MTINTDSFQKFIFQHQEVRGEWVRIHHSFKEACENGNYPQQLKDLLGETICAAVLLSGTLKFDGKMSIHAQGSGPLNLLVAEVTHQRSFRALAQWQDVNLNTDPISMALGNAQLAITIEPDKGSRYQGIVPLERPSIAGCLEQYFQLSEQLDTRILIYSDGDYAAGLLLQKLPGYESDENDDYWLQLCAFVDTLSLEEIKSSSNSELSKRLFHQEDITLFDEERVEFKCNCSKQRTAAAIESIGVEEALKILESEADITVDCQFCHKQYRFVRDDINRIFGLGASN